MLIHLLKLITSVSASLSTHIGPSQLEGELCDLLGVPAATARLASAVKGTLCDSVYTLKIPQLYAGPACTQDGQYKKPFCGTPELADATNTFSYSCSYAPCC